ncbi:MAG: hypothetical protein WA160_08770 [Pseudobdellovibrio sp.]
MKQEQISTDVVQDLSRVKSKTEYKVVTVNGSKFVVFFIIFSAVVAVVFCNAIYQSYLTRPKITVVEENK